MQDDQQKHEDRPEQDDNDKYLEYIFTDARDVRSDFDRIVIHSEDVNFPIRVFLIHGISLVGKTTALRMIRLLCRKQGITVGLVDVAEEPGLISQISILNAWNKELSEAGLSLTTYTSTYDRYFELNHIVNTQATKELQLGQEDNHNLSFKSLIGSSSDGTHEIYKSWLRRKYSSEDADIWSDLVNSLREAFIQDLKCPTNANKRIVLMLDSYDKIASLDKWICSLINNLPKNVITVIAAQAVPYWERYWPGYMGFLHPVEMLPMLPDDIRELIKKAYKHDNQFKQQADLDLNPEVVDGIVKFAQGLPMVARTAVLSWSQLRNKPWVDVKHDVLDQIFNEVMAGVSDENRKAFKFAAILRKFDESSLHAILECDATKIIEELKKWPFVYPCGGKWSIHDKMRKLIIDDIRLRSEREFTSANERAVAYYQSQQAASPAESEQLELEILYHKIFANEADGINIFRDHAEFMATSMLRDRLQSFLDKAKDYDLKDENKLWVDFYNARLDDLKQESDKAVKGYQAIVDNVKAEPILRAYALFYLGCQYSSRDKLGKIEYFDKAESSFKKSLNMIPEPDNKLIHAHALLCRIYRLKWRFDDGLKELNIMMDFHEKRGDIRGKVSTLGNYKSTYCIMGDWGNAYSVMRLGKDLLKKSPEFPILTHSFEECPWIYIWTGRYSKAESVTRTESDYFNKINATFPYLVFLKDLCLAMGMQGKYEESLQGFLELHGRHKDCKSEIASLKGYWGLILTMRGNLPEAEKHLQDSIALKEEIHDELGISEVLNWQGELCEAKASGYEGELKTRELESAKNFYLASRPQAHVRYYIECGAVVGLARVSYLQNDYRAAEGYLDEADELINKYKYKYHDYAAQTSVMRGHMQWRTTSGLTLFSNKTAYKSALENYKKGLMHALQYNRFVLDEILSGQSRRAIPLIKPILTTCIEHGEEGHRLLEDLRTWWEKGVNTLEGNYPGGIPLQGAEKQARENERGDGKPQQTVIEQIDEALSGNWAS